MKKIFKTLLSTSMILAAVAVTSGTFTNTADAANMKESKKLEDYSKFYLRGRRCRSCDDQ